VCGWRGPSPGLWSFVGSAVVDCPYCLARLAQEALAPGGADLQAVEDRAYRIAGGLLLAVIVACTSIAAYLWVLLWLVRK
jgi:hypothetical protein